MANDAAITLPKLVISSATVGNSGNMTLPLFTIEARVLTTGWQVAIELPALTIEARSGAVANIELPALSVEATALVGAVGTADIILPDLTVSAYTSSPIIGTADLTIRRLQVSATSVHDILANGDMELRLFFVDGTASLAGVITGYAINLKTLGLSEYEDFNFNSACLIGGIPFGANSLGLFRLDADNDSGTLIASSFSFPLTDFGIDNKKRIRSAFYGGKADGRMKLFIENDEENERERLFIPGSVRSKTKIPIGREGKGSYWKVRLTNIGGCDFKLDTLEIFPVVLGRG